MWQSKLRWNVLVNKICCPWASKICPWQCELRQNRHVNRVASNYQRAGNLEEAPSIRAALELLSARPTRAGEQFKMEAVKREGERCVHARAGEPV